MKRTMLLAAAVATALTTPAFAQVPFEDEVKARQGVMAIIKLNMGVLGGMVRGTMDYDAAAAQSAANAVLGVSMVPYPNLFPEGSDSFSFENTKAKDAVWEDMSGFTAEWAKVQAAAPGLADAAGQGMDALSAALGGVSDTCRSCHMSYRSR